VNEQPIDLVLGSKYPYSYWNISETKSYGVCGYEISCSYILSPSAAGIAILSKIEPLSVTRMLPNHPDSRLVKGRIITLEFKDYYVIGTYVVNAGRGLKVTLLCDSFFCICLKLGRP